MQPQYKHLIFFSQWLYDVQRGIDEVPSDVYDQIKQSILDSSDNSNLITTKHVRQAIKLLHLNKYYEYIHHITNKLNNIPMITLDPEVEKDLKSMHKQVIMAFYELKKTIFAGKNCLPSIFLARKILELLDKNEYFSLAPYLKNREKVLMQHDMWKSICEYLEWNFILPE